MEEWNKKVRDILDESESVYQTRQFIEYMFQDLIPRNKRIKIKNKEKFNQRLGPEFELWAEELEEKFANVLVREILGDDEFWTLSLEIAKTV
jgi:hypothetical protein